MTLRVAVIGLGEIARKAYLPLLSAWEGVEPLFCTRRQAALASLQSQYHVTRGTTDLRVLLDWQPTAAFVLTPTPTHASLASKLLEAGIDVYLEKPAAGTSQEARLLAEQAESAGRILMVGFNRRFAPLHRQARDLWAGRAAGIVVLQKHRSRGYHSDLRQHYTEELIHLVDILRFFCGEGKAIRTEQRVEDGKFSGAASLVALESGGQAAILSSMRAGHWQEQYALHGEGASMYVDAFMRLVFVQGEEQRVWEEAYASSWKSNLQGRGFHDQVAHFLDCVRTRAQPEASAWEALKTQELVEDLLSTSG
jgi:virulence factor